MKIQEREDKEDSRTFRSIVVVPFLALCFTALPEEGKASKKNQGIFERWVRKKARAILSRNE